MNFVSVAALLALLSAAGVHGDALQPSLVLPGGAVELAVPGGSTARVFGADRLADGEAKQLTERILDVIGNDDVCSCFCRLHSSSLDSLSCSCVSLLRTSDVPLPCGKLKGYLSRDPYGLPWPPGESAAQRFRYQLPAPPAAGLAHAGMVLSVDGGDRRSWRREAGQAWSDVSGSGLVGTLHGRITWNGSDILGGGALLFGRTGGGDRVIVNGLDISPSAYPSLTMEVWVRLLSVSSDVGILIGNEAGTHGDARALLAHSTLCGTTGGTGATCLQAGPLWQSSLAAPPLGRWLHIVGTWWQNGDSYIYRNLRRAHVTARTRNAPGSRVVTIGNHQFDPRYQVHGYIASARVWTRALSPDEVEDEWNWAAKRLGAEPEG